MLRGQTPTSLSCFPSRFCQSSGLPSSQVCQELMTVGTRLWGIGAAQNLLRVKIYEFAVYMDGQQVHLPACTSVPGSFGLNRTSACLCSDLFPDALQYY